MTEIRLNITKFTSKIVQTALIFIVQKSKTVPLKKCADGHPIHLQTSSHISIFKNLSKQYPKKKQEKKTRRRIQNADDDHEMCVDQLDG